jgi:bla regulator protein BlaR1
MQWINMSRLADNMLVQALFRTFLHSLWEGIILAISVGIVILFTRKAVASIRYNLFAALLVLFLGAVATTFVFQLREFRNRGAQGVGATYVHVIGLKEVHVAKRDAVPLPAFQAPIVQVVTERFDALSDRWAPYLMVAWAFFFLARCTQLIAGFCHIHRLRHTNLTAPGEEWILRARQLAVRLGINKCILLVESGLAKTPQVIGYFKPMILIPMGLFTHLPADQLNAILLHELGHIRRHDYLVNLLQYLTDAIFFFNPAVLWLSALLRRERECCCDNVALRYCGDRKSYLDALIGSQEYQASRLAMPFASKVNPLFDRIRRMVSQEHKALSGAEKVLLLIGIIIIFIFGFIRKKDVDRQMDTAYNTVKNSVADTVLSKQSDKLRTIRAGDALVKQADTVPVKQNTPDDLVSGPENFTGITKTESDDGESVVATFEAVDNRGKKYVLREKDEELTDISIDGVALPNDQLENYAELIPFIERIQEMHANHIPKEWEENWLKMERLAVHFAHEEKKAIYEIKDPDKLKARVDELTKESRTAVARFQAEFEKKQHEAHPLIYINQQIAGIISDLRSENLFTAPTDTSLLLDNNGLYFNGKRQSQDIYERLKDRYIRKPTDFFRYANINGTIQTQAHQD